MLRRMKTLPLPWRPLDAGRLGMMVQGKGHRWKAGAGFASAKPSSMRLASTERAVMRCCPKAAWGPRHDVFRAHFPSRKQWRKEKAGIAPGRWLRSPDAAQHEMLRY